MARYKWADADGGQVLNRQKAVWCHESINCLYGGAGTLKLFHLVLFWRRRRRATFCKVHSGSFSCARGTLPGIASIPLARRKLISSSPRGPQTHAQWGILSRFAPSSFASKPAPSPKINGAERPACSGDKQFTSLSHLHFSHQLFFFNQFNDNFNH